MKGGEGRALGLSREENTIVERIVRWRTDGNGNRSVKTEMADLKKKNHFRRMHEDPGSQK